MVTNLNDAHIVVGEHFVNADVSRVVEAIHAYEPLIEVQFIPPQARAIPGDRVLPAFKLVYHDPNGPDFTLFHVEDETQFNMTVLARIIHNDQRNGAHTYTEYEAWEKTQELIAEQKRLDELEEIADIAEHVLKTPLNKYTVNKNLVIKSGIPFNAKNLKD